MDIKNSSIVTSKEIIEERKKRILSVKSFVFLIFSILIIVFLMRKLELSRTIATLQKSDVRLIALAVLIYFTVNFFKTLRYKVLLGKTGLLSLFVISSFHNFFNMILPARTGELTFVYYAKKIGNIDVSKGLHVLLIVRIYDFIVISAIFISSILFYYGLETKPALLVLGIIFFVISIILMINLRNIVRIIQSLYIVIIKKYNIDSKKLPRKISEKLALLVEEFAGFNAKRYIPMLTLTSLLVWFALYMLFFIIILAFGIEIDFIRSIIGSTGGVLTNVLPINSFGSFGTLEAGWAGFFMLVGFTAQEAIITGFGSHIIDFFSSALLALFCMVVYKGTSKK